MEQHSVWEIVFLMLILKIPIVYLCLVVYWAIRAEPRPEEGAGVAVGLGGDDSSGGGRHRRARPRTRVPRPHGGPSRFAPRAPRTAFARGERDRP
jgi:hypothetical protein